MEKIVVIRSLRTSKSQAADANVRDSASNNGQAVLLHRRVDIDPLGAGADFDALLVLRELDTGHADKVDRDAGVRVAEPGVAGMAAAFDGEMATFLGDGLQDERDVFSRSWLDAARRDEVLLFAIPDREVASLS